MPDGGFSIRLFEQRYRTHRVIWAMQTGTWPGDIVRHRDGDRSNNRFDNLYDTTRVECQQSTRSSATGEPGVYVHRGKRYLARLWAEGRSLYLGSFGTVEEAKEARCAAERKYRQQ